MQRFGKMNTIGETRYQLNRLIRSCLQKKIETITFRNLVYGFSVLLQYHKAENEIEIERRLDALELQLEQIENKGEKHDKKKT